jgi:hypothetical protein
LMSWTSRATNLHFIPKTVLCCKWHISWPWILRGWLFSFCSCSDIFPPSCRTVRYLLLLHCNTCLPISESLFWHPQCIHYPSVFVSMTSR